VSCVYICRSFRAGIDMFKQFGIT